VLWYAELFFEFSLLLWLALHRDGRPRFEAMLFADFITQVFQIAGERLHHFHWSAQIWYVGVIIQIPLISLALREAADYRPVGHRRLLFWWFAVTFGCAWIRIFPYTGTALLWINLLAFAAWLGMAMTASHQSGTLRRG
jgi:hypothetical protein